MPKRRLVLALCAAACLAVVALTPAPSFGGPLDPPAGPIAPTQKTLAEVEPRVAVNAANTPGDADSLFKISQPGSYYLTGNITGTAGKNAVEIAAVGVTLDLNGFDLVGVPGSLSGVYADTAFSSLTITNGSLRAWGASGIECSNVTACLVDRVRTIANGVHGIFLGHESVVTACVSRDNTFGGIIAGEGSTITDCTASINHGSGIVVGIGSTVAHCTTYFNGGNGVFARKSTVTGCTVSGNSSDGIDAQSHSTIESCSVTENAGHGVTMISGCLVRACNCRTNGFGSGTGADISVAGADNRLEGNNCTDADIGIFVTSAGNIIVRNTCSGNTTNWSVVAGNICLVVNATVSGAINGNSGGTGPGSTDPSANFTY
jgi:parallel beta-helix repeat protein